MTQMKRRLSILLCFLMVFTSVFVAAPTEARAEETTIMLNGFMNNSEVQIMKNAKNFYVGDYITAAENGGLHSYKYLGYLSQLKGVTYNSSKPSVATISNAGLITTKKTGTTEITVTYKKTSVCFTLKVTTEKKLLNNLSEYYRKTAKATEKSAQALIKEVGSNPTLKKSNRYKLLNAIKNYNSVTGYTTTGSFIQNEDGTQTYIQTYLVYSSSSGRANLLRTKIANACYTYNPFSTTDGKHIRISSIKGTSKSKKITVTLKKAVTADNIFGANYVFSWDTEVENSKTYSFPIVVQRTSNGRKYYGEATITKGKKTMTITLKNHKLVKGETYKLLAQSAASKTYSDLGSWLDDGFNKNTFKVTK